MKSFNKLYRFGNNCFLGVDQSGHNEDKTCLIFSKYDKGVLNVIKSIIVEPRNDIEELINKNMNEIKKVFKSDS